MGVAEGGNAPSQGSVCPPKDFGIGVFFIIDLLRIVMDLNDLVAFFVLFHVLNWIKTHKNVFYIENLDLELKKTCNFASVKKSE